MVAECTGQQGVNSFRESEEQGKQQFSAGGHGESTHGVWLSESHSYRDFSSLDLADKVMEELWKLDSMRNGHPDALSRYGIWWGQ